ncbi:MAG TPA: hypothetical protein VGO47_09650 [Chlamydiales bacterium]|nr:hypothetical protein [Chlamydiales bacterium]
MHNLRQSKIIHQHKRPQHEKAAKEVRAKINSNSGNTKKNKAGANFIDIYASDEDISMTKDAVFDAEAGYDAVFQRLEGELLACLQACAVCNPLPRPAVEKKMCFLTKYGQHRHLSLIQVREWVDALVAKEHLVSISSFLFMFISNSFRPIIVQVPS